MSGFQRVGYQPWPGEREREGEAEGDGREKECGGREKERKSGEEGEREMLASFCGLERDRERERYAGYLPWLGDLGEREREERMGEREWIKGEKEMLWVEKREKENGA